MASIQQPGVTVIQELRTVSPTVASATLPACIIGPAYEVIDVLDSSGLLNSDAATELYEQAALSILQTSFPAPRANADELDVEESSVRGFLLENNVLTELPRGDGGPTGSAFLAASNVASRASLVSERGDALAAATWSIASGDTLILAIDNPVAADTSEDVTVNIVAAAANATAAEVVAAINTAFGATVAAIFSPSGDAVAGYVQISSLTWGAASSVTLRGGTAAAQFMRDANVRRVEGSGYRAQDDLDGDLTSPWVHFYVGEATVNAVAGTWGPTAPAVAGTGLGRIIEGQLATADHTAAAAAAQVFSGVGVTVPLSAASSTWAGDQVFVDGVQLLSGEVIEVQPSRFRLGTLNTSLSTFDDDGDPTTRVYDVAEANVMIHAVPLAPRNVWFQAQGLQWGSVSPAPVAAVLTGTVAASVAQVAEIQSDTAIPDATFGAGFDFSGLTLVVGRTVDGVVQANETFTFPGGSVYTAATGAAMAAAIDAGLSSDLAVSVYRDVADALTWLRIATTATGADQAVSLVFATSTAATTLGYTADASHTGKDPEFASPATVLGVGFANPGGLNLTMSLTDSRGVHTLNYTFTAGPLVVAAAVAELELPASNIAFDGGIRVITFSVSGGQVLATSVESGATVSVTFGGAAQAALGIAAGPTLGTSDLNTTQLLWSLDDSACAFDLTFTSDSIDDAISGINLLHGMTIASMNVSRQLVLTSPMGGVASNVNVTGGSARTVLGLSLTAATGSGRPNPDFYLDLVGAANFGAQILRNSLTGAPFCPASAQAYLQYRGLRQDVSALSTATEKLLTIDDTVALAAALSPLDDENPLGLAMFLALLNSPTTAVTGIGVDAVSTALPEGTLEAYARSTDVLEAKDVYTLVPLSTNEQVHQLFSTHVTAMSQPAQRGERIVFINPVVPTRGYATILASGDANSTANPNELALDQNPSAAIVAQGLTPAALLATDGVYVEVTVANELRRYNVSVVNGSLLSLRVTFAAGENDDSFYSTTALSTTLIDVDYTMRLRGDQLLITGTTLTDLPAVATAVASAATAYLNRRVFYVFPDTVSVSLTSGTVNVPAYYAAAAVAGMIGQLNPSQGFTNYPISGLSAVQGSDDTFKPSQLDTIAGGGVYILYQTVAGAPVMCRHQLSTNTTSVERRELSITKAIDYVAKFMRNALRNFIGSFNITPAFLDQLSTVIQGQLAFLGTEGLGVVADATLNNVIQDEDNPDTILVDVTLEMLYPANYIRVTLVV